MKRLIVVFFALMLIIAAVPGFASTITVGDPLWYEFGFGAAPSDAFSGASTVPSSGGNSQYAP